MRIPGFAGRRQQSDPGSVVPSSKFLLPSESGRRRERVQATVARLRWDQLILPVVFFFVSGRWFASYLVGPGSLGFDARLYAVAARALIEGRDPWHADLFGAHFAGPPTTLIPFLPFAYLPEEGVAAVWIAGSLVLAILVLRKLGLPSWWLSFPPLFFAIVTGSVEVLMVALLVAGGALSGLAAVLKPYAALPLLAERRWRALVVAMAACAATLLVLPWGTFVADLPYISDRLQFQSFASNAFGNIPLMLIAAAALLSMGIRRALWLATPVLWPNTQVHYAAMTLPVITPLLAVCWALDFPNAMVVGVVLAAISHRLRLVDPLMVRGVREPFSE